MIKSLFKRSEKLLSTEVNNLLKGSPFTSLSQKLNHNLKKAHSFWFVFGIVISSFVIIRLFIPYIQYLPDVFLITIKKESAAIQIEKRIANIVTLVSVSFVVLTFIINISDKQRFGKDAFNLILEEIYFFPILYFVLTTLGLLVGISAYQDTVSESIFVGLAGTATYVFLLVIIAIGFLFKNVAKLLNTNFLFIKRLERLNILAKIEIHQEAYKYLSKELFLNKISPLIKDNKFQYPNQSYYHFHLNPNEMILNVDMNKLYKFINRFISKNPHTFISVHPIILKEKLFSPLITTGVDLSAKEVLELKTAFKQKKDVLINKTYENEIDALKIMIWELINSNNNDVDKAEKIFTFFYSLIQIFSEIIVQYRELLPKNSSWWLVPRTILEVLFETIQRLSRDNTNSKEFKQKMMDFIVNAHIRLINHAITSQNLFLYQDFIFWLHNVSVKLSEYDKVPNYIFESIIYSYTSVFSIINNQYLQTVELKDKKELFFNTIPKLFRSLDNLTRQSFRNKEFERVYFCIKQIKSCELDEGSKEEIFSIGRKITSIKNEDRRIELQREYYILKYPFSFQNSILILFASTLYKEFHYGNIEEEPLLTLSKRMELKYSNRTIKDLINDWLWINNHREILEQDKMDFHRRNEEKWFFIVQLLKNRMFVSNALEEEIKNEDLIYHNSYQLKETLNHISNKKQSWLPVLGIVSEEEFDSQKNEIIELIKVIENRYKLKVEQGISKAELSENLSAQYKNNVHKGYTHSFEMDRFLYLFDEFKTRKIVQTKGKLLRPIVIEELEEKRKLIDGYFEESIFMPDLFGYIEGNDLGRKLARKESQIFINRVFEKIKPQIVQDISELDIDKCIKEMEQRGYKPNIIILNVRPSKIFKRYQEKLGSTEISGWQYTGIPYRYLHLKETTPFFMLCQFEKAFEKIQLENSQFAGNIIDTEITEITLEEYVQENTFRINEYVEQQMPKMKKIDKSDYLSEFSQLGEVSNNWIDEIAQFHIDKKSIFKEKANELYNQYKINKSIKIKVKLFAKFEIKDTRAIILGKQA